MQISLLTLLRLFVLMLIDSSSFSKCCIQLSNSLGISCLSDVVASERRVERRGERRGNNAAEETTTQQQKKRQKLN